MDCTSRLFQRRRSGSSTFLRLALWTHAGNAPSPPHEVPVVVREAQTLDMAETGTVRTDTAACNARFNIGEPRRSHGTRQRGYIASLRISSTARATLCQSRRHLEAPSARRRHGTGRRLQGGSRSALEDWRLRAVRRGAREAPRSPSSRQVAAAAPCPGSDSVALESSARRRSQQPGRW